jgi:uncharacterized protein (TIGR00255 family)
MTGMGSFEADIGSDRYRIDLKSVNHRFLDLKIRTPRDWPSLDLQIRDWFSEKVKRGAVELRIERAHSGETTETSVPTFPKLNLAALTHYRTEMLNAGKSLGLDSQVTLAQLFQLPSVWEREETQPSTESQWNSDQLEALRHLVSEGAKSLLEMRSNEGARLVTILGESLAELRSTHLTLQSLRSELIQKSQNKIRERVKRALESFSMGTEAASSTPQLLETRVAQEIAMLLEKSDVEEELSRFGAHLDHLSEIFRGDGPVGKKIDFLIQELNREATTLANKSQDLGISDQAMRIKLLIEQMREQVMNLE